MNLIVAVVFDWRLLMSVLYLDSEVLIAKD